MAFSLFKILEPFWLFNFHLFQPQASPNPLPQSRRIPTQPQPLSQGLFSPKPAAAQILGQVAARAWLAAAGSWRRGQVEVELRQATGGLGHAGLGRQKKVKKKSQLEKSNKSQKKSNVRILALADYWRQQKVKKKVEKKVQKKSKMEKVKKKSKTGQTKEKKSQM